MIHHKNSGGNEYQYNDPFAVKSPKSSLKGKGQKTSVGYRNRGRGRKIATVIKSKSPSDFGNRGDKKEDRGRMEHPAQISETVVGHQIE